MSFKNQLEKSVSLIFGPEKSTYNKRDFVVLHTATFGEKPSEEETVLFFKRIRDGDATLSDIKEHFVAKFNFLNDTELHILEIFKTIDREMRCYITARDIIEAWKEAKIPFSLELLMECFNLVASEGNVLDFFTFRNLYIKYN